MMVDASHAALEQAEEALDGVGVNIIANILTGPNGAPSRASRTRHRPSDTGCFRRYGGETCDRRASQAIRKKCLETLYLIRIMSRDYVDTPSPSGRPLRPLHLRALPARRRARSCEGRRGANPRRHPRPAEPPYHTLLRARPPAPIAPPLIPRHPASYLRTPGFPSVALVLPQPRKSIAPAHGETVSPSSQLLRLAPRPRAGRGRVLRRP